VLQSGKAQRVCTRFLHFEQGAAGVGVCHPHLEQPFFIVDFLAAARDEFHRLAGNQAKHARAVAEQLKRLSILGLVHDTAEPFDAPDQHFLAAERLGEMVAQSQLGVQRQVERGHRAITGLVHRDLEAAFGDTGPGCNSLDIIFAGGCRDADQQRVDLTGIPSGGMACFGDEACTDLDLDIHVFLGLECGHVMTV